MIPVPVNEPDGPPNLETKYVFHRASAPKIICWLKGRVRPDKEYPAGIISSIYYDSRGWDFLNEKINSDYLKSKVRLRWYLDFETETPLGALSIVRFRTPIKEPEEIGFIMLVVATSLCCATFNMVFLVIILFVAVVGMLILGVKGGLFRFNEF